MTILPMRKCNSCGAVFSISGRFPNKCPKCNSEKISKASPLDYFKRNK